jgi:hypothetical protein
MEFSEVTKKYWQETDWQDLTEAESMTDLGVIAMRIAIRMPEPIIQVCGPIANGGLGSIEKNLNFFNKTIIGLQAQGLNIFDQMPFEEPIQRLKLNFVPGEWVDSIQNDFYLPIFKSGKISALYFINGWEHSGGSVWEHKKAKELGIEIKYL